jgi:hypothetical protein
MLVLRLALDCPYLGSVWTVVAEVGVTGAYEAAQTLEVYCLTFMVAIVVIETLDNVALLELAEASQVPGITH